MRPSGSYLFVVNQIFKLFACFESRSLGSFDLDRFVVARIAAFASFTLTDFKRTETDDLDFITLGEAVANSFEYGLYSFSASFFVKSDFCATAAINSVLFMLLGPPLDRHIFLTLTV